MMDLLALPIGSIIVFSSALAHPSPPDGWRDITGTLECIREVAGFKAQFPDAAEFLAADPLFCIKKVAPDATS